MTRTSQSALGAWWDRLAVRERRMVAALGVTFVVCGLVVVAMVIGRGLDRRRARNAMLRDATTGDVVAVISSGEDVTELRQAEAERSQSEARFQATFEQAAVGMAHVGFDGRFLRINDTLCAITGYDRDGGYAELCVADERFCFPIPVGYPDLQAAPLLCAGLIGYRSLRLAGDASRLGLYGFGAAAHIVCQVAVHEGREVLALTRPGDEAAQGFARALGAAWAGDTETGPPEELDAAIIFAPAGELVPTALRHIRKGGVVVCAGIHMSEIPSFPYELLWGERVVRSVANLTRADGKEFLALAPTVPVRTEVASLPLERANEALARLRAGDVRGALVLVPDLTRVA